MSDASSTHDSAAASIHACLLDFATASSFADLDLAAVHAARASVASSRFSAEWVSKLRGDALLSYNHATSLRKRALTEPSALSAINHVRALCLAILELGGAMRDMDKGQHAKHWARTGMQFMIGGELDEADRALGAAARLLRETIENESDEMIETELLLKGYQSHLAWARLKRGEGGSMKQVIQHIEDAHAVLEQRAAGVRPRLDSTRLYLAEHCCFRVAGEGYELAELSDAPTDCVERRQLVRLLDLALALLGTSRSTISSGAAARATPAPHGPYDDDSDRSDHRELRDKIARLRSWLFLLDDEVDQATYALNQHSQSPLVSEYIIMRSAILFRSHQPAEASAQTIEFLRAEPDLPHDVTSDAVELLIEHGAFTSALTSINLLSERLVSAAVGAPDGTCALRIGSPASRHFSELQILKFQLLTHEVPDTAAASEHVEALLDGHVNGRAPLEEDTLRVLASKLWKAGCEHYQQGDLHRCVEAMERSYRLLENTSRVAGQVQAMATLSHCYLQQDRLSLAVGRAQHSLKLLADHGLGNGSGVAGGSLAVRASVLLRDGRRFADHDEEDVHGSRAIARIVLVKAKVREGDIEGAHEQVDSLLAANDDTDHLLLAAVCEELVSTGSAYLSASIRILERYVRRLIELPPAPAGGGDVDGAGVRPSGADEAASNPVLQTLQATSRPDRLAAATRSLVQLRMQAASEGLSGEPALARPEPEPASASLTQSSSLEATTPSPLSSSPVTFASLALSDTARMQMRSPLLADLQTVIARVSRDGLAAVCDDPAHVEWLAEAAWHLAYLEGQRVLSDSQVGTTRGNEDAIVTTTNPTDADARFACAQTTTATSANAPPREQAEVAAAMAAASFCADFSACALELISALPSTESRLHNIVRGHSIVCQCALKLAALTRGGEEERPHLSRASRAISAAFRSHKALSHASVAVVATTLTDGDNPAAHDSLHATLQLLNFEVALFRDDPNANEILARVAETPGVSTCQLRAVADLAFECGRRELGARALEHTYARLEALEPPPYVDLIDVLRDLIRTSDGRSSALQHFKRALRLFESSSSDCDVPIVPTSEMQWFLTESWNKGVQAFHEDKLEEAESWMAQAFRFSNLSSALQPYREDLNEGYETTIKMITSSRTLSEKGTRRATEWKSRMGRRILEADMDHETRKAAKRPRVSASA